MRGPFRKQAPAVWRASISDSGFGHEPSAIVTVERPMTCQQFATFRQAFTAHGVRGIQFDVRLTPTAE